MFFRLWGQQRTMIWHIAKQTWMWGPKIPNHDYTYQELATLKALISKHYYFEMACGVALNRTVGLIVFPNPIEFDCIGTMTYDFVAQKWLEIQRCFYRLKYKRLMIHQSTLKSASYFSKDGKRYID